MSSRPIFIIGNPRSGTSLLRLLLTCHSEILIPPECGFLIWLLSKYSDWQPIDNNDARLNRFIDDLFACKKFETWYLERSFIKEQITHRQPASYAELCMLIYASFGMRSGKSFRIWGDKNNYYLNHLTDLFNLYNNARFLHIVRDGRDVACSYRTVALIRSSSPYKPKLSIEIADIAEEWARNLMKVDAFLSVLRPDTAKTLKYEDLVKTPQKVLTDICEWLDIPFEKGMLFFHEINRINKLEPDLTIDWKRDTLHPINSAATRRFDKLLSNKDKDMFFGIAGDVLRKFEYI